MPLRVLHSLKTDWRLFRRYEDAIREFEEAYRLSNRPALLYNIAQAYRLAGTGEVTYQVRLTAAGGYAQTFGLRHCFVDVPSPV